MILLIILTVLTSQIDACSYVAGKILLSTTNWHIFKKSIELNIYNINYAIKDVI